METQFFVDIVFGVVTFLGGWLFKVMYSQINRQKDDFDKLMERQRDDYRKLSDDTTKLALSLPDKYVTRQDFLKLSEQIGDRFDKLEDKIDGLNK